VSIWWHGPEHVEKDESVRAMDLIQSYSKMVIIGCPIDFELYSDGRNDSHGCKFEISDWMRYGFQHIHLHDRSAVGQAYGLAAVRISP